MLVFDWRASSQCSTIESDMTAQYRGIYMKHKPATFVFFAAVAIIGCGGSDDSDAVLYKPTGSLQCSPSQTTQVRLDEEVSALRAAGAKVTASACANDGLGRPALCGVDNGDLYSVTVSRASVSIAQQLGYASASANTSALQVACR
jgi:hypothetical protein